ncbi:hypothetical protein ACFC1R_04575 [Kitasatospora sp. NPDC056138]|uniref:hypothetical protein n=1 Tax=Kitasatospora sp. NPDC056138 TaxID=3345724 RepID=UPI0035E1D709
MTAPHGGTSWWDDETAGFAEVRCFGSHLGAPYDQRAERLIVRTTKGADTDGT